MEAGVQDADDNALGGVALIMQGEEIDLGQLGLRGSVVDSALRGGALALKGRWLVQRLGGVGSVTLAARATGWSLLTQGSRAI